MKFLRAFVGPSFVVLMLTASLWLLHHELRNYHLRDIVNNLFENPAAKLWSSVGLTLLNYVILGGYDWLGIRYIRRAMSFSRIVLASFLGYAVGNNFGTLLGGILFSLLKGFDYEEALILGVILLTFLPCRRHFYRTGALLTERFSARWFAAILLVIACTLWLMVFAYKHVEYSSELWWQFAFRANAPRSLRAIAGAMLVTLVFSSWRLFCFELGMAPLSGVDTQHLAPMWNRIASLAYRHGEHFYNFQGLRQYKEKFEPVWSPKYLASPGSFALPVILTNVATLISGGLVELVKK